MSRVYNFSAGPAILPEEVLVEAQSQLVDYKGAGMSLMEMSHRGKEYEAVHTEAVANLKRLMGLGDDFTILFQTGGASGQFALVPLNLLGEGQIADYINAGSWGAKAIKEAKNIGKVNAEQMALEGALITRHPLLIQKTMADRLSDKVQVIIAPPSTGGFIGNNLLGNVAAATPHDEELSGDHGEQ